SAVRFDDRMRAFYERVKHRKGDQKAIIAVANKMLKIVWFMLTRRELYKSRSDRIHERKLNLLVD
ncbi:MAG: IS110 family transposase, partial [Candidatus Bathyarchaeia archaeon]